MAFQLFMESLRIRLAELGKDHQDVSFTLYNLGLCHQLLGNYADAVLCLEETLRIERLILGEDHRDVALTLFKLAEAHKNGGDLDKALTCFTNTLKAKDLRPLTVARAQNEIANILLVKGDVGGSVEAFVASARSFKRAGRGITSVHITPAIQIHRADFGKAAPVA